MVRHVAATKHDRHNSRYSYQILLDDKTGSADRELHTRGGEVCYLRLRGGFQRRRRRSSVWN